jgi:hypothetical protein
MRRLALLLLLLPAPLLADETDPCGPGVKDAQKLAQAGLRLYKETGALPEPSQRARGYERSLRCFLAAIEKSTGSPAKIYHPLGLVYEKLERYVEAVQAFRRFLAEVPEAQRNPGVTKQITDKLQRLRQHVAELAIDTVPGLDVRVDEQLVGRSPLSRLVVVAPGPHVVIVGDPQVGTLGADVTVEPGQVRRVDLMGWRPRAPAPQAGAPAQAVPVIPSPPAPLPEGSASVPEAEADGRRTARSEQRRVKPWVWVLVGLGGAAVAGTAVGLGVYYGTSTGRPDATLSGWTF